MDVKMIFQLEYIKHIDFQDINIYYFTISLVPIDSLNNIPHILNSEIFFLPAWLLNKNTYIHTYILVRGKFCYILVTWSTIRQFFPRWWSWRTISDGKMLCSPDTLPMLLVGFASISWSTASESTFLGLHGLAWSTKSLQLEKNFFSYLVTVGWLVSWFYGISTFVGYLSSNPFLCK